MERDNSRKRSRSHSKEDQRRSQYNEERSSKDSDSKLKEREKRFGKVEKPAEEKERNDHRRKRSNSNEKYYSNSRHHSRYNHDRNEDRRNQSSYDRYNYNSHNERRVSRMQIEDNDEIRRREREKRFGKVEAEKDKRTNHGKPYYNHNQKRPSNVISKAEPSDVVAENPENIDYPYCKYHISAKEVSSAFKNIQEYKLDINEASYTIRNIPILERRDRQFNNRSVIAKVFSDDYWKMGFISDYFNEHVRVKGKRYDNKESPFDCWTNNKSNIIAELKQGLRNQKDHGGELAGGDNEIPLTYKQINEFLYTKNIGCNTFKPYLVVGIAKKFHSTQMLDFSSGWGDRLIGAIAAGISYVGVDPNNELFQGYKEIMEKLANGKVSDQDPYYYTNLWNYYKMICSPFQTADLKNDTFDLIMTSPPYFNLEIYSNQETQSIVQYPEIDDWENKFLYPSFTKAWSHLRPEGHFVLILNNIYGKPDYTWKAVQWATRNLPGADYLGLLPSAHGGEGNWKSPQPMWIWRKDINTKLTDLYYIGNEKCEMIHCKDTTELEAIIDYKVHRVENDIIYIGKDHSNMELEEDIITLNYGTVTINENKYKIYRYLNFSAKDLNPKVQLEEIKHNDKTLTLICDHLLPGGTKQRGVNFQSIAEDEVVYAGPYVGYAQIAMAIGAKLAGKRATIFVSKGDYYPTLRAMQYGCEVKVIRNASLKQLQEEARRYSQKTKSFLLEFGFDTSNFKEQLLSNIREAFHDVLDTSSIEKRVWVVAGSATLLNVLYEIFPKAQFGVVQVGKKIWPDQIQSQRTRLEVAQEEFYESARTLPPYKSALKYDAKLWQYVKEQAEEGDLIWNVAN